jgi:hypothetical protein
MAQVNLIPDPRSCCGELSGVDAYIGVEIIHEWPDDGSSHELPVYWREVPPGKKQVTLVSLDPLKLAEPVECFCGWSGEV